uniref:Uncharacterized protein n=1 Tax=Lactuca sativa TaxID=4236 RepID=A0A9R1XMY1_LACSA|nr:hypothetical protein LSAT_V11C200095090 [Lactuca sativa]
MGWGVTITLKSEEEVLYISKSQRNIKTLTKEGYKMLTKGRVSKEPHNHGDLKRLTIRVLGGRGLKATATTMESGATCTRIVG